MKRDIQFQRWQFAQTAESSYWNSVISDPLELLRITYEKVAAVQWASKALKDIFGDEQGTWVEIGIGPIGPIGIGCIHLFPKDITGNRQLLGVDPLSQMDFDKKKIPLPLQALIEACHTNKYSHLVNMGEDIQINSGSSIFVACYNVLDHCYEPRKILSEITRILKPGGYLLLGCDVYSWAGLMKYRLRNALAAMRLINLKSIGDVAHPHQFLARDLENLLRSFDLELIAINRRNHEKVRRFWSHSYRMLIVARKQFSGE